MLDIKAKRGNTNLSFEELEFCKSVIQHDYNIPHSLYLFLKGIGEVKDATIKTVFLANHQLPVTVVQGSGGYHSNAVDEASHNLRYTLIRYLRRYSDGRILRSGTTLPNFRKLPQHTRATRAMCGYFGPIGAGKEVRMLLNSVAITANQFDETIGRTRLNIHLLQKVSDSFMGCPTFRNEKVKIDALTVEGDSVQLIKSTPTDDNIDPIAKWTNMVVRPKSSNASAVTTFGASYLMGYQLYKEAVNDNHTNWYYLEQTAAVHPWAIPAQWILNRNARAMPPGMDIERFASISEDSRFESLQGRHEMS